MKIYLDTGNVKEIEAAASTGLIDGVTTNPTLIAREGKDFIKTIKEIIQILQKYSKDFTVSAEVTSEDSKTMIKQARDIAKISKYIMVKIPMTKEGMIAVKTLSREGIKCNVTLCFSANQALLAAKAGAYVISPFEGRLDDIGEDGTQLIHEIRELYDNFNFKTQILAASIRTAEHVKLSALYGADIATMPMKVFQSLFNHPLTDAGLEKFKKDWDEYEHRVIK